MIHLVCSADAGYIRRITPYLESLAHHLEGAEVQPTLITVDCDPPWDLPVKAARQDTAGLSYAPPLNHLQAGGFLDAVPGADDDLLIFTDGDIVLQRPPTYDEIAWLQHWPADAIGLGYNAGPEDTLFTEYWRLGPRQVPEPQNASLYAATPLYNTGVVIARRAIWRRWYEQTAQIWPMADGLLQHYAKQQWAMNLARQMLGLPVIVLPQTIHTHGCYALPHGCSLAGGVLTYLGTPVLFRHHV